jgi:hypothetical protein
MTHQMICIPLSSSFFLSVICPASFYIFC